MGLLDFVKELAIENTQGYMKMLEGEDEGFSASV